MISNLRAIDLYSGVGGWSLGLRLAGIDVISSYELWGPANETNFKNNAHQAQTVDIRRLSLDDLPPDIDIVVGSPPCTQFSFSNRGGGGNLEDGLRDIKKFLAIVDHLKPRFWAMENVPRVSKIIDAELELGGKLAEFRHLGCATHIVDMSEYGLPQRRRRCIAGNFDFKKLQAYRTEVKTHTLGDVIAALSAEPVADPLFGVSVPREELSDHVKEDVLSEEEVRINRANKTTHVIYNAMPFPDALDRSVRTITATCTRVSRESVVIPAEGSPTDFRRLTLRERACLQGFPITFQFYGSSYSQKLRMIGNAVPPAFSYLMGKVLNDQEIDDDLDLKTASRGLTRPKPIPIDTPPDRVGARYPANRSFRFAVPSLQLKSGVRFELRNDTSADFVSWQVYFYFGTSKQIKSLQLDSDLYHHMIESMTDELANTVSSVTCSALTFARSADIANMQTVWTHKGPGGTRPFMLLDALDEAGSLLIESLIPYEEEAKGLVDAALLQQHPDASEELPGVAKLHRNSVLIIAGLLLGSSLNPVLAQKSRPPAFHTKANKS
ncbi:DNA cytosine methyltransferase [Rhodophyticola sp. CCM32]|uniref:DNA cytosine methyltransferase n=1 Tax=Rhodophyticola sp. CCM32 TaxID=2916397 RepID=UPI00143CC568|nr:DNA (cytosine-5-)-methyltransferase [Rhodophyticola sp. CCM32]